MSDGYTTWTTRNLLDELQDCGADARDQLLDAVWGDPSQPEVKPETTEEIQAIRAELTRRMLPMYRDEVDDLTRGARPFDRGRGGV